MHLRDKEVSKIIAYAKSLGVTVEFKAAAPQDPAGTYEFGSSIITVYKKSRSSKTYLILTLLHELGHHLDWIYRDKKESKLLERALSRSNTNEKKVPKHLRKAIYEMEVDGTHFMPIIAKELDLKIPMWKIEAERDLDRWTYWVYYKENRDPFVKEIKAKRKQLQAEYKEKYSESK